MTDQPAAEEQPTPEPEGAGDARPPGVEAAARRRRLAEIFGDVLPDRTSDEHDPSEVAGAGDPVRSPTDEELLRNVPPHHS